MENHEAIHAIVGEWVGLHTLAECQAALDAGGVPASRVYATSDIVADPHYAAREQVLTVESTQYGSLLQPGIVPRLTGTAGRVRGRAPQLGEHNEEIFLGRLGLDAAELEELREQGAV
jgi:crotonobetainyl-CoA:carnitine CoA-transferase CaiB-like acyl-CoA transferase